MTEEIKKQKIEQLAKWGYEFKDENKKLTDFLILHWEDTQKLAEAVGKLKKGLFEHVLPTIGNYITEKNWPSTIKSLIEIATTKDAEEWFNIRFINLRGIIDEHTLPYIFELIKIPNFYRYAKNIQALPEASKTDIKNCLGPELISILKTIPYVPDAIMLIPFMKILVKLFLQHKINIVYALDKSGRIIGFLFFCVMSNLGLSKRAKFYFMNVKKDTWWDIKTGVLYSEKQKKELAGKNVLLIDESIVSGDTLMVAEEFLFSFVGRDGRVIPAIFSDIDKKYRHYAITSELPSWYYYNYKSTEASDTAIAGVKETEQGIVEVNKETLAIATEVRIAFSKYGKIIAAYLKENMGI